MIEEKIRYVKDRLPQSTRLVAVSKFRPVAQLQEAYDAGQRLFAESRPLELEQKVKSLPRDIEWHFIGHLQTNKLKNVVPYVSLIHSMDSLHLAAALEQFAMCHNINMVNVLLEVHIGQEATKQGFSPSETPAVLDKVIEECPHLRVCGLMGMASHTDDDVKISEDFALIHNLFDNIVNTHQDLTDFRELSIGMSSDWKIAIKNGATLVRIGSFIFDQD